jgi:RHH-type proline utilization regulon transcriptional repressor/proline dehydrogenase/delta 1-pyrroline-5-carboxylate dehydrogenase
MQCWQNLLNKPHLSPITPALAATSRCATQPLQILVGNGAVGAALTCDARLNGVAFTGSTATTEHIRSPMATPLYPRAPLIVETGGINAMIVDSTALPEQAVTNILESAFQSAGQRCSALRCVYVQDDIAAARTAMLIGAMQELSLGDPWRISTDIDPVIDAGAKTKIAGHIVTANTEGRVLYAGSPPSEGHIIAPTLIKASAIAALQYEVFGPVLHIATFASIDIDNVIKAINPTGYDLTFGLQSRISNWVADISKRISAGNIYVNRNQIGAVVGSQPFGVHGL